MPILLKGGQSTPSSSADGRAGSTKTTSSADGRAGTTKTTSSAIRRAELDGRAGSTTGPAQPSAELDQSSSAVGRAGSNTPPARPSAELDQSSSASLIEHATSSAIRRAGPVQFDGWPSWTGRAGSNTRPARPSPELDRTRDQLSHPQSWTSPVWRMAELERSCCLHPVLAAPPFEIRTNMLLFHLDRSHRWNFTI